MNPAKRVCVNTGERIFFSMKLIFLDIDGTFTAPLAPATPESAVKAVHAAQKNGHKVFLFTGRNWSMAQPMFSCGFDGAVCSAGGLVLCNGETLYDHPMTDPERDTILTEFDRAGVFYLLETRECAYMKEGLEHLIVNASPSTGSEMLRWRRKLLEQNGVKTLSSYAGEPVYKVVFMIPDANMLTPARERLENRFEFCFQDFQTEGAFGELINRDFDKGKGIRVICGKLGVPLADTIGFGDSMNDLAMIETVGTGVCMENGSPELKKHADRICPPAECDGIATAFAELGLI